MLTRRTSRRRAAHPLAGDVRGDHLAEMAFDIGFREDRYGVQVRELIDLVRMGPGLLESPSVEARVVECVPEKTTHFFKTGLLENSSVVELRLLRLWR